MTNLKVEMTMHVHTLINWWLVASIRIYGKPLALATSSIASHPPQVRSTMAEYPFEMAFSHAASYDSISSLDGSTARFATSNPYVSVPLAF